MKSLETQIKDLFEAKGYTFDPKLNLIGIQSGDGAVTDQWDDLIGIISDAGMWLWSGTTDPGRYYTDRPMVDGCAHLIPGQYKNAYTYGRHFTQDALVQIGEFEIWRDIDRDGRRSGPDRTTKGVYGMNLHAGEGNNVGQWSAGCQVIKGFVNHAAFMAKLRQMAGSQSIFDYTLIVGSELI